MFKRAVPAAVAFGIALSSLLISAHAASGLVRYPVGSIGQSGYLLDNDTGAVDLSGPVTGPGSDGSAIPYGETVYYPLLNSSASGLFYQSAVQADEAAREILGQAKTALEAADRALRGAEDSALGAAEGTRADRNGILLSDNAYLEALANYNAAKCGYDEALSDFERGGDQQQVFPGGSDDPYVCESEAVSDVKIKAAWEEGPSFVDSLSIVRKRLSGGDAAASRFLYFLAVTTKGRGGETSTAGVRGTVSLKKSGDYGFSYDEVELGVDLTLDLDHAGDGKPAGEDLDGEEADVPVICDNETGINYNPPSGGYSYAWDDGWSQSRPTELDGSTTIENALASNGLSAQTALRRASSAPEAADPGNGEARTPSPPALIGTAAALVSLPVIAWGVRHRSR